MSRFITSYFANALPSEMSFTQMFIIYPLRLVAAMCESLYHSWLKGRWTPSSKSWLMRLDQRIRTKIEHKNNGDWVKVKVADQVHDIWTVSVEGDIRDTVPIVIIHGMGGGSDMFLNNIDAMAKQRDVFLIDLPGFGLSSRPQLRVKYQDGWWIETTEDDIEEFYTEVLDKWFIKMDISKCILLGHSYGGYLSSVYCLTYPNRVKHLILADPWGYPQRPVQSEKRPFMRSRALYLLSKLYAKMYIFTPIRALGPVGPAAFRTLRGDIGRKFSSYFEDHTVSDYLYHCNTCDEHSGEVGFFQVSIPFGWARKPMVNRVVEWDSKLDVTFIYGARSWVDSQPGYETRNSRHDSYVDVQVISGAGHHVYADRPQAFNNMVHMIGEAVDQGRKPNISHASEQRIQAMSSLRRRVSSMSQSEMCNDELGIRQPMRSFSESEVTGRYGADGNIKDQSRAVFTLGVSGGHGDSPSDKRSRTRPTTLGQAAEEDEDENVNADELGYLACDEKDKDNQSSKLKGEIAG